MDVEVDQHGREIVAKGPKYVIVCAKRRSGRSPAADFLTECATKWPNEADKFEARFRRLAMHGQIADYHTYHKLDSDIWQIRSGSLRILHYIEGNTLVLTHGFKKQSQKTPRGEIDRAVRIREEDRSRIGSDS
ncbi:MAG: type II toxin-antitoxin system RelE/ParE family toxin [Phycisphaerae bacterium]